MGLTWAFSTEIISLSLLNLVSLDPKLNLNEPTHNKEKDKYNKEKKFLNQVF
jgi:hypothetical protein